MCLVGRLIAILMIFTLGACGSTCGSSTLQPGALPVSNTKIRLTDVDHGESTYTDQQCYQPNRKSTSNESKIDWGKTAATAVGVVVVGAFIGAIIVVAMAEPKVLQGFGELFGARGKTSKSARPYKRTNEPRSQEEEELLYPPSWTPARS